MASACAWYRSASKGWPAKIAKFPSRLRLWAVAGASPSASASASASSA